MPSGRLDRWASFFLELRARLTSSARARYAFCVTNPLEIPVAKRAQVSWFARYVVKPSRALSRRFEAIAISTGFCVTFGLGTPILCLWFDPIFFRTGGTRTPFTLAAPLGYSFIALQLVAMSYWLLRRRPSAWLRGILAAGAIVAAFVSLVCAPFGFALTLESLRSPHGIDRAAPLIEGLVATSTTFTFAAYAYSTRHVTRDVPAAMSVERRGSVACCAFVLAWAIPLALQIAVVAELNAARRQFFDASSAEVEQRAVARIRRLQLVYSPGALIDEYRDAVGREQQERISRLFEALTGSTIPTGDSAFYAD